MAILKDKRPLGSKSSIQNKCFVSWTIISAEFLQIKIEMSL